MKELTKKRINDYVVILDSNTVQLGVRVVVPCVEGSVSDQDSVILYQAFCQSQIRAHIQVSDDKKFSLGLIYDVCGDDYVYSSLRLFPSSNQD
jgi:hypothetical protein